ncbi:MAG: guanylate kinase [Gammaproteobacteria bacterium RIFCSPHIGHO2_12_FULL_45_9]|nr:MAG: guanylate kinase [Gammaproteobacteria bacterium RIFCSPHIGHO2_12_FULL_45_9]
MGTGQFFIIAAPSGAGKTSLVKALLQRIDHLTLSISYTTRPPRPQDQNGRDYHFVTDTEFKSLIAAGDFLEYAKVYQHYYGTGRAWVLSQLAQGLDVILEIDWQGAKRVHTLFPEAALIFILPPSLATLRARLQGRSQDAPDVIELRMQKAREDIAHYADFGYLVINDDFDHAVQDLVHIVMAERLRASNQSRRHHDLLQNLLGT